MENRMELRDMQMEDRENDVAVVGMSCRFPGAADPAAFWENLRGGVESIRFFSDEELREVGIGPRTLADPAFVKAYGTLDDAYAFDAPFFGVTNREAQALDPQHRVFLECAWSALEDAGCDPARFRGAIGVYAGSGFSRHVQRVMADEELMAAVGSTLAVHANDKDFLATRVSYKLGLRGPSVVIQTACSTSLVAIHVACQSLLNRECDVALAGGATIAVDQAGGYRYQEGGILSPDGHCRAFDAKAAGTIGGSGAGVVVLKRFADAVRDGDVIHAVVKGSAINNDGAGKIGFTAPSVEGQSRAIAEALALAGVDAADVSYVETHGTGTPLGDPIEIAALTEVFGGAGGEPFCALGAVKTNVGHLDTAAGVAGFIKTVLALKHRALPPTLHFRSANPETGLDGSPFYVNAALRPWESDGPRRAGVSSFGIGGTNAHVVLEEAPRTARAESTESPQLLVLSAKTETALERVRAGLAAHLEQNPDQPLADIAFTLQEGRAAHRYRWAAAARDGDEARSALAGTAARAPSSRRAPAASPSVAFLFPGQGTQYAGMARELYAAEPVFRDEMDRCARALTAELGLDLRGVLFPAEGGEDEANALLQETRLTQPALFAVEYSLAKLWMSWGVQPAAMLGHSIGEYVAACIAGVFSPECALRLVAARGRMMQSLPAGSMLAVPLPECEVRPLLPAGVSLAAVNSAAHCVVSGDSARVDEVEALLAGRDVAARRLHTSHAFHSASMDPILDAFAAEVRRARPAAPSIAFLSNVTGDWITAAEATDPDYWVRHLRGTVRFADGVGRLLDDPARVLLEVGPGETLGTFARRSERNDGTRVVVRTLPRAGQAEASDLTALEAAGALWTAGVSVDWTAMRRGEARRVQLPTYPFERQVHRVAPQRRAAAPAPDFVAAPAAVQAPSIVLSVEPQPDPTVVTDSLQAPDRLSRMAGRVTELFAKLVGTEPSRLRGDSSFLELGADSLLLMQLSRNVESTFGVRVPFRRLLEGMSTIGELSAHLVAEVPAEQDPDPAPAPAAAPVPASVVALTPIPVANGNGHTNGHVNGHANGVASAPVAGDVSGVIAQQMAMMQAHAALMQQQLALLGGGMVSNLAPAAPVQAVTAAAPAPAGPAPVQSAAPAAPVNRVQAAAAEEPATHGPHVPISATLGKGGGYTEQQQRHFEQIVERYTARTRKSKAYAQESRPALSDNRASLNFRMASKELLYPVVGDRSQGSRLWDVDGNEYVDFTIGFGVHFFGHRPPFIMKAVEEQLAKGCHTGPQSDLAGPTATLFRKLTGMERVTFCNTGSEAVMTALRIARTVTGREKIVLFEGSYHGCFDGILARPGAGASRTHSRPVAPGTTQGMIDDVVVLPYGPEAMEYLRANARDLAAVLVEPVRTRDPENQPREFLHELRALCDQTGTALIFDEMITGLRLQTRGAQGFFGVDADMATYGKVIGGGFPLGIVAGKAAYMDAIDGGMWQFGDDSFPAADQTFFAGTFCKHPVTMAAANAVLRHIEERGEAMYDELHARTARLVADLRRVLEEEQVPIRIRHAGSFFKFAFREQDRFVDLMFFHMLMRGIYIWEGRACFVSTAHTDEDCGRLVQALRESIGALREGGFLPGKSDGGPSGPGGSAVALSAGAEVFAAPADAAARSVAMTPAQRQVWTHAQMGDDASRAYNEQFVVGLRGAVDAGAMRLAVQDVVAHHEALRTVFDPAGQVQHILPSLDGPPPLVVDESDPAQATPEGLAKRLDAAVRETFDLAAGPLFRVHVHARGPERYVLQFVIHHVAADGLAIDLLERDLEAAYRARRAGQAPTLAPAMQFSEYAALLAEHAERNAGREAEWLARFDGAAPLVLPADRHRPLFPTNQAGSLKLTLGLPLASRLRELGRQQGCTLFMTLLGGLAAALHRISGQDDLVVGIPSAGRTFPGSGSLVGHCVDVLPIRTRTEEGQSALRFLKDVRGWLLDAYEDEVFTSARLHEKAKIARGPGLPPLISVVFNLEPGGRPSEGGGEAPTFGGVPMERVVGTSTPFTKFDLQIDAVDTGGEIMLVTLFNTDLFDRGTVARMLGQLERVLEQVTSRPDVGLAQLDLLGDAERRQVVEEWNRTDATYAADLTIHQVFEAQAERTPHAVAASFGDESLTYAELNAAANQLAHHLRRHGVGPEVRVGLCLERSLEMVVSILATLKAGGAYVPMDPGYPADRLAHIVADSGVPVLVTQQALRGTLPMNADVTIVSVDADAAAISAESAENPESGATPESLAYVIYTSGSTGKPKGALIEHRNVARLFSATDPWFGFGEQDVWTLFHSYAFDFSVWELWGALLYGGRVVVVPFHVSRDPEAFHALVQREGVTVLNQTPSAFRQFIRVDEERGGPLALREVIFGGEALEPATLREWVTRRGIDTPRLVNMYGITETTVHVTYRVLANEDVFGGGGSPIGERIPDLQLYVLDGAMQPLPVGMPGELYVGGGGVARGYHNRPELTAQRFVVNPFGAGKLYRTGDRVRWLADGTLEYLGRLDEQVKIRGFRIELGEIEAALLSHDSVRECAVIVREDAPGDRRIVAYLVGNVDVETLRPHLRQGLPEYMVPAAFVSIDRIPLTGNGKLDRKALPVPEYGSDEERYVAPRSEVETTLAAIWADVLRVERVGVEDSFFELGGDSILCIQVVARARRAGVEVSPRQMFEHPTIAGLAGVVGRGAAAEASWAEQGRVDGAAALTPIQAWFFEQEHPSPAHANQSMLLAVDAAVPDATLRTALAAVLEHHDALRLRYRRTAAGWEQWHAEQVGIALECADLSSLAAEAQDAAQLRASEAAQAGLDLENGPVGRAILFDRGGRGRVMLLVLHHLVVDGVSWRILREDLERACAQIDAGEPVELGAKSTSYRQWAESLQALAAGDALAAEADFWTAQGPDGVPALPVDGEGGRTAAASRTVTVKLDADETRALLTEVPAAYRTQINDVLLCALAEAVGAWSGGDRIRIALEGHGREEEVGAGIDLTRTVGWFTSVYPVVLDVAGAAGTGDRIKRVKEQLRAIPLRGIGYGVLRYLGADAVRGALAAQAEPEIVFNYLGQFDGGTSSDTRFRFAGGRRGAETAGDNRRRYLLDVNASVIGGQLQLGWTYGEGTHAAGTIQRLADAYLAALRGVIAHCREEGAGGFTPSDFPLAKLSQAELDAVVGGRTDVEDLYPLSPMQGGMLFHALYGGESQAYQVQVAQRLQGALDVDLFRRAWNEVAQRHAILRTSFVWEGLPQPLQRVHATADVPWTADDWSGMMDAEQELALDQFLADDRARGFVIEEAPLMRCALFAAAPDAYWFVWSQHHLLTDGWSTSRLWNEVFAVYRARSGGQAPELRRVRPYRDYIGWLARQDEGAAERYWRGVLDGFTAPTPLGVDRPAGAGAQARNAVRALALPAELTQRLDDAARRGGVTLNTLMQGAWGLLLSRYSGQDDVVFGTTVSGRPAELEGVEEMVGLFINTQPVRMRVDGDAKLAAWLGGVQRMQAEAREYEYAPLGQVQGWSGVPRGTPLFESHLIFENYPVERSAAPRDGSARIGVSRGRTVEWNTYPLSLMAIPGRELRLSLSYDENRFDADTAGRLLGHLRRVLEQVAEGADVRLADLELIGAEERREVVEAWNRTAAEYPADRCIHQLFEAQAEKTPDAVAVTYEGASLTYGELDARANRLANHLAGMGVGPEVRVGLCLERSLDVMTAILGVMKSGGAYVPVDPAHPAERIAYVMGDSGVSVLLTQLKLAGGLPALEGVAIVAVDRAWETIAAESAAPVRSGVTSENLAYVIYTSGSTGRPKGVAMHHRGVANYIHWGIPGYGADQGNGSPVFSSMAVDLTITNLLPLFAGHPVRFLPEESPVEALADALRQKPGFGLIKITPVHLALLNDLLEPGELAGAARTLVIGADFLSAEPTVFWQENAPGVRLMNEYGPTETVVGCSAYVLPNGVHRNGPVPVGGPIQNLTFYVLDARMQPVPVGVPGELYIGGAGVARGYLGRPALSAEKFVPDAFAARGGARMYRTGDRARWLPGGSLMILGRTDNQVKLRGYRVELGEIETVLRRHDSVRGALVVVREDAPGDRRLVAYVAGAADAEELREHLRASVPEYMVPAAFVMMETLPQTATGKIDPKTLPAPEYATADADAYLAPRTPVEQTLAAIWSEVLRVERVGVHDGFFALGGDSILSIQVVSRARRAGLQITPRQVFEYGTIAELASVVGGAVDCGTAAEQGRVEGSVALTPIQASFFAQEHARPWHENQSTLLAVDGSVDDATLEAALAAVFAHHDALRLRFRRTESGWEQWHAAEVGIALERVDLSALSAEAQDAELARVGGERQASFDLERGPLGAAVLFDRGERGRALLIALHHLVVDGVSWRILGDDLERACGQLQAGQAIDLGDKSTSYRQWAQALEAYASADALAAEAGYWLAQGPEGVAPLPADGEGSSALASSRTVTVGLDADETRALLAEVPAAYRTQINDALLAALAEAVGGWSGGDRVRIALEGHGREEEVGAGIDLTRTVGWFTSVYPVVLDVAGAEGPGERLKRVKEQLRAVPVRGIGYGVLRWLSPDADVRAALEAQALPEIVFNYLGQFDQAETAQTRFRPAAGRRGPESSVENRRQYALTVNGAIRDGRLQLGWTYGEGTHTRETVERLAEAYLRALRGLIAHCREAGAGGCTPSDFPLAALTRAELDAVVGGRTDVEDLYPLTPMQEGMLFHSLVGGGSQAYQVQVAQRLEGRMDVALFQRAWAQVAGRHAILRTAFVRQGLRRPMQRVESAVQIPWQVDDWSGMMGAEQEQALDDYLAQDRARGFTLEEAPLMRCALFTLGDDTQWFVWSLHHLLTDGWSTSRVLNEVFRLYRAWSTGEAVQLTRVRPYRDYIAWLQRQDAGAAERFWRGVLEGFTTPTPLASDRPAVQGAEVRNTSLRGALPAEQMAKLEEFARRMQVTLPTVIQGAWALLLGRYAGERDVVFGTTASGRPPQLEGVEEMIGLFINTLPTRVPVPGGARIGAWLAALQRQQAEAREYEYAPLVQVQGWSEVPRGTPLFESLFVFENYPMERAGAAAGAASRLKLTRGRRLEWNTYPLTLLAAPGRELHLTLSYDQNRFDAATVGRMMDQLRRVLAQMAQGADLRLSELDLVGDDERRTMVQGWNDTERPWPRGTTIHGLFEAQAAQRPDAVALVWGGTERTYIELDAEANQLANHLAALGVGPESRVAVMMERSAELVVSLLAILKAGGCYVPLDPTYPRERLQMMLQDSDVRVLVTRGELRDAVAGPDLEVVCVDEDAAEIGARSTASPQAGAAPENLAYIVYTSGSTGRPKGVMVGHREIVQLVCETDFVQLRPGDRVAQASNASFDALAFEAWGAFLNGATLVGIPREVLLSPAELRRVLREERITTMYQTTALLNQLSREHGDIFASLREVLFGGQAVDADSVRRLLKAGRPQRLLHVYGPTETTAWCTYEDVRQVDEGATTVSVGTPIGNARVYLLDADLHPVPVGAPGEAYVGGWGVVRGYLNRPSLTAERFVPDPFSVHPGARMYRTGDRLKWKADGTLEFITRLDEQVKIRGFRIEPGEVESALNAHPDVREARVVVREDAPGEKRLVAYVVGEVEADGLRAHLRRGMPDYMVPAAFVVMAHLPLTPNGKLDVKALPAPEMGSAEEAYAAPRTPVEETLAAVWREVLGVERVGRDDGFFELGGHSLLMMQLHARLRDELGREIPIVDLFRFPTIGSLAEHLDADPAAAGRPGRGSARAAKRRALAGGRGRGGNGDNNNGAGR